ncbi:hypothetical protein QOT17_016797 [Balamuthia mandrillaris]
MPRVTSSPMKPSASRMYAEICKEAKDDCNSERRATRQQHGLVKKLNYKQFGSEGVVDPSGGLNALEQFLVYDV